MSQSGGGDTYIEEGEGILAVDFAVANVLHMDFLDLLAQLLQQNGEVKWGQFFAFLSSGVGLNRLVKHLICRLLPQQVKDAL